MVNNNKTLTALSKIERLANHLFNLLYDLDKNGVLNIFSTKSGLIQTCNYALENSQSVIQEYTELKEKEFNEIKYLALYGLLQALFVQQDAMNTLYKTCLKKEIDFKNDYIELYKIREIRNITIGHPTNKGNKYYLISQMTMKKNGYFLIEHDVNDKKEGHQIELIPKLILAQETGIFDLFDKLILGLKKMKKK